MARKGGKREKATLKYDKELYTPEGAKNLSEKELRKEYSRLRSIARKRLERFEGTEWEDSQVYRLNKGVYKPLKQIESNRELRHLLSDLSRFVTASTSSVSGLVEQRRKTIETLQDRGYSFVNKDNYKGFTEFMEYARIANQNRLYDSKRVAEFYAQARKEKLTGEELKKAFRKWSKQQKNTNTIRNKANVNSDLFRKDDD